MKAAFLIRCSTDKQDYQRQIEDLQQVAEKMNYEWSEDLIFGEYIANENNEVNVNHYQSLIFNKSNGINDNEFNIIKKTLCNINQKI